MTPAQSVAYDRLLQKEPILSYADIAELRQLCRDAVSIQEDIARQDEWILKEQKPCTVVMRTADGLNCWFRGELPKGLQVLKRPVRRREIRCFSGEMKEDPLVTRLYEFSGFIGSSQARTVVFKEVVG